MLEVSPLRVPAALPSASRRLKLWWMHPSQWFQVVSRTYQVLDRKNILFNWGLWQVSSEKKVFEGAQNRHTCNNQQAGWGQNRREGLDGGWRTEARIGQVLNPQMPLVDFPRRVAHVNKRTCCDILFTYMVNKPFFPSALTPACVAPFPISFSCRYAHPPGCRGHLHSWRKAIAMGNGLEQHMHRSHCCPVSARSSSSCSQP